MKEYKILVRVRTERDTLVRVEAENKEAAREKAKEGDYVEIEQPNPQSIEDEIVGIEFIGR
jgi:hypothetical protein